MSLFLAEDLMLPLLSPIHATKKERNSRFSLMVPRARVEVRSTRANTIKHRPHGRAINYNLVRATAY